MLQNLLFTMSLAGTVVFLLYILLYPLAKRYFSLRWRYGVLKLAVVFYLVPFPLGKFWIMNILYSVFPELREKAYRVSEIADMEYISVTTNGWVQFSPKIKIVFLTLLFLGIVSFGIVGRHLFLYQKLKKMHFFHRKESDDQEAKNLFLEWKRALNIRKNVEFISSKSCNSPVTCGYWSPVILFPLQEETNLDKTDYNIMIKHELVHIKHRDLLIKYLGILTISVHWFNPFSYFLFHELTCIGEMYCDEEVLKGKGNEERRKYGELLLMLATEEIFPKGERFLAGAASSRNKKVYRRRVLEMMLNKKRKIVLSMATMALVCMTGGITCFAYNPPTTILNDSEYEINEEFSFMTEEMEAEVLPYDFFFEDEEGNVYDANDVQEDSRALCSHDFCVQGTSTTHNKDGNGGCVVRKFESVKCIYCNTIKVGNLISSTTYTTCPH